MNVGDAISVGRRSISNDFPVDSSSPLKGMFEFFEDNHAGSLAEDEAVAIAIEWPGRSLGIGVVRRECGEQVEPGHTERMNHAVSAAGQHRIRVTTANEFRRFANRLTRSGTCREAVQIRTLRVKQSRQMTGWHVRFLLQLRLSVQSL